MPQTPDRKFRALSHQTNRQYAWAVIYGEASPGEATAFGLWVLRSKLNHSDPKGNWEVFMMERSE